MLAAPRHLYATCGGEQDMQNRTCTQPFDSLDYTGPARLGKCKGTLAYQVVQVAPC
jgi:hypothetical protein